MSSGGRQQGRPPEDPGADHYSTSQASEIIGKSEETIREWIRTGRLAGDQYVTQAGQTRYRATKESVQAEAIRLGQNATPHDVDISLESTSRTAIEEIVRRLEASVAGGIEKLSESDARIEAAIARQRVELSKRLENTHELFRDYADAEKQRQSESIEIQRKTLELLRRVEQAEAERQRQGRTERRSFLRRLFPGIFSTS